MIEVKGAKNRERYLKIANDLGELLAEKNAAYGDSFVRGCEILRILYPDGVPVNSYPDMLSIIRCIDKMFRIATDIDAFGESPWKDLAGYAILSTDFHLNRKHEYVNKAEYVSPRNSELRFSCFRTGCPGELRGLSDTGGLQCSTCGVVLPRCHGSDRQDNSNPSQQAKTDPINMTLVRSPICPGCEHDHGRASCDQNRSCLFVTRNNAEDLPVYCGCRVEMPTWVCPGCEGLEHRQPCSDCGSKQI